jgi:hypothetical protein
MCACCRHHHPQRAQSSSFSVDAFQFFARACSSRTLL